MKKSRALRAPIHSARRARLLRRGIRDARRRMLPYWANPAELARANTWQQRAMDVQPRAWAYRCAFIRTDMNLPPFLPVRPAGHQIQPPPRG